MADELKTQLFLVFIFTTVFMIIFSFIFRGYIWNLTTNTFDDIKEGGVPSSAKSFLSKTIDFFSLKASSNIYIISILIGAYGLIGLYLILDQFRGFL